MSEWTSERPRESGWYWMTRDGREPVVVHVDRAGDIITVEEPGLDVPWYMSELDDTLWSGPLVPPKDKAPA